MTCHTLFIIVKFHRVALKYSKTYRQILALQPTWRFIRVAGIPDKIPVMRTYPCFETMFVWTPLNVFPYKLLTESVYPSSETGSGCLGWSSNRGEWWTDKRWSQYSRMIFHASQACQQKMQGYHRSKCQRVLINRKRRRKESQGQSPHTSKMDGSSLGVIHLPLIYYSSFTVSKNFQIFLREKKKKKKKKRKEKGWHKRHYQKDSLPL